MLQSQMDDALLPMATGFSFYAPLLVFFFFFGNSAELAIHMLLIYMRLLPDKQLTGDKRQFDWGSLAAHVNELQVVPTSRKLPGEKNKKTFKSDGKTSRWFESAFLSFEQATVVAGH